MHTVPAVEVITCDYNLLFKVLQEQIFGTFNVLEVREIKI